MKLTVLLAAIIAGGTLLLTACEKSTTTVTVTGDAIPESETTADTSKTSGEKAKALTLDDSNFDTEIKSGVVLVDFWATWCPPCRTQGPIVDDVAGKVSDFAKVGKLDVDKAPKASQAYGITSIPTLIIFKDGKKVKQFVGVTQADELVKALKNAAGK